MLRAHYISMSLATVIRSLKQFSTSLFVRLLFVHWEPFHDLADPFAIACIENQGLVSVWKTAGALERDRRRWLNHWDCQMCKDSELNRSNCATQDIDILNLCIEQYSWHLRHETIINCNPHLRNDQHKFVCTLGATTNICGLKYRIQGQFSKSQGKCSNHFALHILGVSV